MHSAPKIQTPLAGIEPVNGHLQDSVSVTDLQLPWLLSLNYIGEYPVLVPVCVVISWMLCERIFVRIIGRIIRTASSRMGSENHVVTPISRAGLTSHCIAGEISESKAPIRVPEKNPLCDMASLYVLITGIPATSLLLEAFLQTNRLRWLGHMAENPFPRFTLFLKTGDILKSFDNLNY